MLDNVLAVIGPPATGKTTLTTLLAAEPGRSVFRLRDHVSPAILTATATSPGQPVRIHDVTVARALRGYLEAAAAGAIHVVLTDSFPGSATQVTLLLSVLRAVAPGSAVRAIELTARPDTITHRIRERKVCPQCEPDPAGDPRQPAEGNPDHPWRCARCDAILFPRRSDAPRLLAARASRYQAAAPAICHAFAAAGISTYQLDTSRPAELIATGLSRLLTVRTTTS